MKIRTALLLAGLILLTGAAFAEERTPGAMLRNIGEGAPIERAERTPTVPYYLDGVLFPAGHPLPDEGVSIVLGRDENGADTVHIFTNKDVAKEYRRQEKAKLVAAGRWGATANSCTWTETYSWFNTAVGCGNSGVLTLYPGNSYSNLDFGGWNNTISCVKAACYVEDYTVLYSCRNFQMYTGPGCDDPDDLWVPTGHIYTDLNNYGFNNRTSSIQILP